MKFIDRISQNADDKQTEEFAFLNEEHSIKAESDILGLKRDIAKIKRDIENSKSCKHLSLNDVYELDCKLELLKRKLKAFRAYKKELF